MRALHVVKHQTVRSFAVVAVITSGAFLSGVGDAATTSTYAAGSNELEFQGLSAGFLHSFQGGASTSQVIVGSKLGQFPYHKAGDVIYTPTKMSFGSDISKPVWLTVKGSLDGTQTPFISAVEILNLNNAPVQKVTFYNAFFTEIDFPALDGGSKDQAFVSITQDEQLLTTSAVSNGVAMTPAASSQKSFMASAFRVDVSGGTISRVTKVGAIVATGGPGTPMAVQNFTIEVGDASAFVTWNKSGAPHPMTISYLTPDLKTVILAIALDARPVKITAPVVDPKQATVTVTTVELSVSRATLSGGAVLN